MSTDAPEWYTEYLVSSGDSVLYFGTDWDEVRTIADDYSNLSLVIEKHQVASTEWETVSLEEGK